jgi:hypothetical protein
LGFGIWDLGVALRVFVVWGLLFVVPLRGFTIYILVFVIKDNS